jgi:ribokinase
MLTIIGDINVDLLMALAEWPHEGGDARAHTVTWSSGGTGINSAVAVARVGGHGRLWGRVGNDPAATQALTSARAAGVDLQGIQSDDHIPTGLCVIPVTTGGERTFLSYRGANQAWQFPSDWPTTPGWLHVCGHALLSDPQKANAIQALNYAQHHGWQTSIDLCEPLTHHFDTIINQLTQPLSVLLGNQAEMQAVASSHSRAAPICITKQGANGALVAVHGQTTHYPAFVVDAIDTTACGDTFASVCVLGLTQGAPLADAVLVANAAGAITASRRGAADIVPTHLEVCRLLQQHQHAIPPWLATMVQYPHQ